ncbi:cytochrome c family protein [Bradyrhizobium sp. LHD-71]|uniref:c-type cytochrome n=1 Tax=Bradyrhizobium sp. LHD-71 TaxID=3072141 RepID=UPI00280D152F|nr:cytochrome c family protein [Bradyrhizobium sp. LHD-71]MDQ8728719.1 cytochrome c family protein [Bradyrhizobium sp. LHD-71]
MRTFFLALTVLTASASHVLAQSAEAGERVYTQCRACHQVGETARNLVGPQLNGIFGRKSGTIEGYNYSQANKNANITWDEATFRDYIVDPRGKVPGTKMVFAGLKNPQQVTDLIAYLKQFDATGKRGQ